ncbi:MAG: hypothetical protein ABJH06_11910 [Paraglaciecola sp.]|uniref:hypothetical protein n=1 Tax=Paraglaciecola sp. TaxID=1920173 RepID=UPI0032637EBF
MFTQHGAFLLTRCGRVLFLEMKGAWNLETTLAFRRAVLDEATELNGQEWSLVTDMTEWELFTPECEPIVFETLKQSVSSGLTREALINNNGSIKLNLFKKYKNKSLYFNGLHIFKRQFFTQKQDGILWLQQEGVTVLLENEKYKRC